MALNIETGTGSPTAQSYAAVVDLEAFAAARGIELPAALQDKERLLLNAMDFLESLRYAGARMTREQALSWPRKNVTVDGFALADDEIPREIKEAQIQAAVDSMTVPLMPTAAAATKGAVLETSVEGAVSIKYAAPSTSSSIGALGPAGASLPRLTSLLRGFLYSGAGSINAPVRRG